MASLSYPEWLPKPLQSGFSMQPEDRRTASTTVGTSFQRGFGGDICVAEVTLQLNRDQATWLEQFERDVIIQGSSWFLFPLWYAGQVHWEHCRFKTRPKASTFNGIHGTYQFSLYVKKRTELMPDCMVKLFACFPPCLFPSAMVEMASIFSILSQITEAGVADALSGLTEG